ncbi:G-protein coupled receptor 52-like [Ptychodera flava]|uniref:G-protein coupled receptor 52-like n=1 Tax=Ptychodera flava TaxID=63121 RepID=UPI003969BBFD
MTNTTSRADYGNDDGFSHPGAYFNDQYHIIPVSMVLVTTLIILGNVLVIAVVCSTKSFANASGLFMISLGCADLGVGLFVTPLSVYPAIINRWPYSYSACVMAAFFTELFSCVSVSSMAMIGVDRYLAISKPLSYKNIMTTERARALIIGQWALLAALCILPATGTVGVMYYADLFVCNVAWEEEAPYAFAMVAVVVVPSFIAIIFCYYHIFRIARKAARQIASERERLQNGQTRVSILNRRRGALTSFVIIGTFCISWTPWLVLQVQESVEMSMHGEEADEAGTHPHLPQLHFVAMWIALSNSFFNCGVYCLSNKSFRLGAKRVLRKLFRQTVCRPASESAECTIDRRLDIWSIDATRPPGLQTGRVLTSPG